MAEPQAYFGGKWLAQSELSIPVYDIGFVLGATITEQLRTFRGEIDRLEDHLERLYASLKIVGLDPGLTPEELADVARRVVGENYPQLSSGEELGLCIFVTPGPHATFAPVDTPEGPTVCVYSYRLPVGQWLAKYRTGQRLAVSSHRQVSSESWPAELKCRSRIHYYLADREVAQRFPGARAVLLDEEGFVSEASTASVAMVDPQEGIVTPLSEKILPSISRLTLLELAAELGIATQERDLRPDELAGAAEILLASTPFCLLPVTELDGHPVGAGQPGPVYERLLAAWSKRVGVDIAAQGSPS